MALDPPTMLTISIALAAAAALYLAIEWRSVREPSLLFWSAGFATITIGSTLALLRGIGLLLIGIWFANGLLVVAHWFFLVGCCASPRCGCRVSGYRSCWCGLPCC